MAMWNGANGGVQGQKQNKEIYNMKKLLIVFALVVVSVAASAQKFALLDM